ncbi:hypothetical protein FB45DRAFT_354053 [Roridomyces roridus]|uniref:DUF2235 domain-containing protein n=1 Tax=Roridomyces roridus TaxID=1738132 RepID=A0AAD7C7F3_9AGAR|nr:hypothetical protein FB45DRAFT_354053 [Roridomyces roridus]
MPRKQSIHAPYDAPSEPDDTDSHRDATHPVRRCRCECVRMCDCRCTCVDHCLCVRPCEGSCGSRTARNLVVSIDGTSNQFGDNNTNVVELHGRMLVDASAEQLTYYNCGVGTYVPRRSKTLKYWRQRFDHIVDLAIAWNFETIVIKAYRWLCNEYRPGDKIFLFGFSRGAYQIRTLAGMVEKVGLVNAGNQELIPFAYEIYSQRLKGKENDEAPIMAPKFKETFSRDVKVHFAGAWDTVSSVGVLRQKPLPLTSSAEHICIFRHALALDERRVKFLPEYADGGSSHVFDPNGLGRKASMMVGNRSRSSGTKDSWLSDVSTQKSVKFEVPRVAKDTKEVWFAGSHSDIGGGLKNNLDLNLSSVPLLWMENEASAAGLRLRPRKSGGAWNWNDLRNDKTYESLTPAWWPLEFFSISRRSFKNAQDLTRVPHLGSGRIIAPCQRIHASVAFKKSEYHPRAKFRDPPGIPWGSFVGKDIDNGDFRWADEWKHLLELDLFDTAFTLEAIEKLKSLWDSDSRGVENNPKEERYWINRLSFIAHSGELAAHYIPTLVRECAVTEAELSSAVSFFRKLAEKRPRSFDADLAELLERRARVLDSLQRADEALKYCDEALTIRRKLLSGTRLRVTARKREKLAICLELVSTYHRALDRTETAMEATKESIFLRRDLADEYSDESHGDLQRSLNVISFLRCLKLLSDDLRALDRLPEALPVAQERVQVSRELAASEPEAFNATLGQSLCHLSFVFRDLGRYEDSCSAVGEAAELQSGLATGDRAMQADLATSLHHMAFSLRDVAQFAESLDAAQNAVGIRRTLAVSAKSDKANALVAHSLNGLSLALKALGRNEDAVASVQEAVSIQRRLIEKDDAKFKPGLPALLNTLSYHLYAIGQPENALTAIDEAITMQQQLNDTSTVNYNPNILDTRANVLCTLGRYEDALHTISEAQNANNCKEPTSEPAIYIRERSAVYLATRAKCLSGLGRHNEAFAASTDSVLVYRQIAGQAPYVISEVFSESVDSILGCLKEDEEEMNLMKEVVVLCRVLNKHCPGRFGGTFTVGSWSKPSTRLRTARCRTCPRHART